jgi:hypothetical protein
MARPAGFLGHAPAVGLNDRAIKEIDLHTARTLFSVLIVIFCVPVSWAQSALSNGMPREIAGEIGGEVHSGTETPSNTASPIVAYAVSAPITFPDKPVFQPVRGRVVDKKFISVMAALGGAETLRFTTHKLVLDNEFAAGAPWVTSVPANRDLVREYAGIYLAELFVAYELKKPHAWLPGDRVIRTLWWAYPAVMLPIHIKNGVGSIRTKPPSGCPPELCGGQ